MADWDKFDKDSFPSPLMTRIAFHMLPLGSLAALKRGSAICRESVPGICLCYVVFSPGRWASLGILRTNNKEFIVPVLCRWLPFGGCCARGRHSPNTRAVWLENERCRFAAHGRSNPHFLINYPGTEMHIEVTRVWHNLTVGTILLCYLPY